MQCMHKGSTPKKEAKTEASAGKFFRTLRSFFWLSTCRRSSIIKNISFELVAKQCKLILVHCEHKKSYKKVLIAAYHTLTFSRTVYKGYQEPKRIIYFF